MLFDQPSTYSEIKILEQSWAKVEPTVKRLLAIGATNVHVSVFDDVHDTTGLYKNEDGSAYKYNGHCSWIYWDNNECYDGDLNAWEWLGQQGN